MLPCPGWLSTVISPPISATKRAAIVKPSPVPPYFRVVDVSSCSKARKIVCCLSRGMPIPVSLTVNRRATFPCSSRGGAGQATRAVTSPASVNLIALPTRFSMICRSRPASPMSTDREPRNGYRRKSESPFAVRPHRQGPQGIAQGVSREKGEKSNSSRPASIFEKSSRLLISRSRLSAGRLHSLQICR